MRPALVLVLAGILSGCAAMSVNKVIICPELKKNPVKQVLVFGPGFDKKNPKYDFPGDLKEMDPENQQEAAGLLKPMLEDVLRGVGLEVVTSYVPNKTVEAWIKENAAAVAMGRLELEYEPINVPAESVLLFGVAEYGRIMTQLRWKAFFEKNHHVAGEKQWDRICDIRAVLVNPATGKIMMEVRHRVTAESNREDPELLRQVTIKVMRVIASAFPK